MNPARKKPIPEKSDELCINSTVLHIVCRIENGGNREREEREKWRDEEDLGVFSFLKFWGYYWRDNSVICVCVTHRV